MHVVKNKYQLNQLSENDQVNMCAIRVDELYVSKIPGVTSIIKLYQRFRLLIICRIFWKSKYDKFKMIINKNTMIMKIQ